ncbi:CRISPR-associated endonuclease Cas1 [Thiolapillus sp.]
MGTLYIDRQHTELRYRDRRLQVRHDNETMESFPLGVLERIVVTRNVSIDTSTLARLSGKGITLIILPGRSNDTSAAVTGLPGNDARRRLAQYAAWHNNEIHTHIVRRLLRLKFAAQLHFIRRLLSSRPDRRHPLFVAAKTIRQISRDIDDKTLDIDALRGLEGAATAAGFRALSAVLPPSLGFSKRCRKPPTDPVNALLSLSYTLACRLAEESALESGLDPAIGFLHAPSHGRPTLAFDLVEPLRPRVESFVHEIFRSRTLTGKDFKKENGGYSLGKNAKVVFYTEWERKARTFRRWLRRLCIHLVKEIMPAYNNSMHKVQ